MSRTDKDVPYWVDARFWEPWHYRCGNPSWYSFGLISRAVKERECDLPPEPRIRDYRNVQFRRRGYQHCGWTPVWEHYDEHGRTRSHAPVPKWFVDHIWNNKERVRVRADCAQARKEYRANGEVDIVSETVQHRHCALWAWY